MADDYVERVAVDNEVATTVCGHVNSAVDNLDPAEMSSEVIAEETRRGCLGYR
jgi:hypothetical protein